MGFVMDFAGLAGWLYHNFSSTKLNMFTAWMRKQGRDYWMTFKAWFWGLNCDDHEELVRKIVPVMPIVEDSFDQLEKRVDHVSDAEKFEECIEIDLSDNSHFNEVFKQDLTGSETAEDDRHAVALFNQKAGRRQRHRIRSKFIERACTALEIQLRTKHGLVPANELNEQALKMSAIEICRMYNINDADTSLLVQRSVYRAMIPDQQQMDAIRIIYNSETSGRRAAVEAIRNSEAFAHYKSGHYA